MSLSATLADVTAPVTRHPHQIADFERRLAEEMVCTLLLEHEQRALDRPDRGLGDIPVFRLSALPSA
jgi:hypothetical protein